MLKRSVEAHKAEWNTRPLEIRAEGIVLDRVNFDALVTLADGGEREVLRVMIIAETRCGKSYKEAAKAVLGRH